jgi:cell division protein FtsB
VAKKGASSRDLSSSQPRRGRRRALQYLFVIVGCVLVADALFGESGLSALLKARKDYRALELALGKARDENARLREEARQLREDPDAVEAIARSELGLIKPGEKLFVVKDVRPPDAGPSN